MTANKEDYIKTIYNLGGEKTIVSNKLIAECMGVSPAAVSEMIAKLNQEGLIIYEAYKGSKLSEKGLLYCLPLIKSHRLWEVFLMRYLGYSWAEAHCEAELLEHASTTRLVERLDGFLNYPKTCPHGSPIPRENEVAENPKYLLLSELRVGDQSVILKVTEEPELLNYLQQVGIYIGEEFELISTGEYEGILILKTNDGNKSLSYKAAGKVYVQCPRE